jgi:hypothetical protein
MKACSALSPKLRAEAFAQHLPFQQNKDNNNNNII